MKRILALIAGAMCVAAIGFSGCFFLDACSGCSEKKNYKYVSSLSELQNAGQKQDVVLTQDIDCDFATVGRVVCKSLDGRGHTIKNAVLSDNAFFETVEISNINFENITCRAVSSDSISIVAYAGLDSNNHENLNSISIENVTVKNSTINMPQSNSSIYAGIFVNRDPTWHSGASIKFSFKNCHAEKVTVQIGTDSIDSIDNGKKWGDVYFGGLVSYGRETIIENCGITDCDISVIGNVSQTVYGGGLVGKFDELRSNKNSITDSYVKDTYITASTPDAIVLAGIPVANKADVFLGGLAGYYQTSGSIVQSYSSGNNIAVTCAGKATVGGLAGYFKGASVSSSYSSDNFVFGGYCEIGDKAHTVGGLIGVAKNCAVSSCFTFNNLVKTDDNGFIDIVVGSNGEHYLSNTTYSLIAGFIASTNSVSATYCAAANTLRDSIHDRDGTVHIGVMGLEEYGLYIDDKLDEFWFGGTALNCYVTEPVTADNSQSLPSLTEDVWRTPNEIKSKLNLAGAKWVFENGKAPYLSL